MKQKEAPLTLELAQAVDSIRAYHATVAGKSVSTLGVTFNANAKKEPPPFGSTAKRVFDEVVGPAHAKNMLLLNEIPKEQELKHNSKIK